AQAQRSAFGVGSGLANGGGTVAAAEPATTPRPYRYRPRVPARTPGRRSRRPRAKGSQRPATHRLGRLLVVVLFLVPVPERQVVLLAAAELDRVDQQVREVAARHDQRLLEVERLSGGVEHELAAGQQLLRRQLVLFLRLRLD